MHSERIENAPATEYRDIPGFPGYRVGDDGSVWSARTRGHVIDESAPPTRWKRLAPGMSRTGYWLVNLCRRGRGNTRRVHHLVLEAFTGPRPVGCEACHGNGDRLDNRASNLRWGTRAENMADRDQHGRTARGERNGSAKLTWPQVEEIRRRHAGGMSASAAGRMFGLKSSAALRIVRGESWVA